MDLFQLSERMMGMNDAVWRRHASGWSVYTRFVTLPLLVLSIYSLHWIGWWCLVPTAIVLAFIWLNPRLFPAPSSIDGWAQKTTIGERLFLERKTMSVPARHVTVAIWLSAYAGLGMPAIAIGVWLANPWLTALGTVMSFTGKLWFCDRMVWLFEDMARDEPALKSKFETLIIAPQKTTSRACKPEEA